VALLFWGAAYWQRRYTANNERRIMDNYYNIICVFILIVIIRFLLYISKFLYLKKVLIKQNVFIEGQFNDADDINPAAINRYN
jgi:hypothetical protein